jgi:hypothetical protein
MIKLLALLFSISAQAATPGAVPSVTVSASGANTAQVSIPPSQLVAGAAQQIFSLYIGAANSGAPNYLPFYRAGVIYQVPSGKTTYCFDITAASSQTLGGTGPAFMDLISATATFVSNASSITGGVGQCGAPGGTALCDTIGTSSVATVVPGVYSFASLTWPGIHTYNYPFTYQVHMDCFEQ